MSGKKDSNRCEKTDKIQPTERGRHASQRETVWSGGQSTEQGAAEACRNSSGAQRDARGAAVI